MGRFCGVHFSLVIHQVVNIVISQRSEKQGRFRLALTGYLLFPITPSIK